MGIYPRGRNILFMDSVGTVASMDVPHPLQWQMYCGNNETRMKFHRKSGIERIAEISKMIFAQFGSVIFKANMAFLHLHGGQEELKKLLQNFSQLYKNYSGA